MSTLKLNQKTQRVEISSFEIDNPLLFSYFNSLPSKERDNAFHKAIQIGVLALKEDRLSAFLSSTANELGTELENLKMLFDLRQELFSKTAAKGIVAEDQIAAFLNEYFEDRNLKDRALLTGTTAGKIKRNKTGDIVCEVDGSDELKIVIECKFDKSIRLGDIESRDLFGRQTDTIWSQLIEANANREGRVAIIVLDKSSVDGVVLREVENVGFIPAIGFIAIVDTLRGDYSNLGIAYMLARNIAVNARDYKLDQAVLDIFIKRILNDLNGVLKIEQLVTQNIETNKEILRTLKKNELSLNFSFEMLKRFLQTGEMTYDSLLEFYSGDEVRSKYRSIDFDFERMKD